MSRAVSPALRTLITDRAHGCCEYCLVPDRGTFFPHEPDHIVAEQHSGETTLENLALARMQCNRAKGTNIASVDPETGERVFLFHPRRNVWREHFRLDGARIVGLTAMGRATARLLKFDDGERVELRGALQKGGVLSG